MSQITTAPGRTNLKVPALLLIATLPVYAVFLVLAVAFLAPLAETSALMSPAQIGGLGFVWHAINVLWMVPPVLAVYALARIGARFGVPRLQVLVVVSVILALAYVVINALAPQAGTPTWGDSVHYTWSMLTSLFVGWFGAYPATLIVVWALIKAGVARKTLTVVGVLYALCFVFEIVSYLPPVLGMESFAEFTGGLPPALSGVFWAVIGGVVLRSRVASGK